MRRSRRLFLALIGVLVSSAVAIVPAAAATSGAAARPVKADSRSVSPLVSNPVFRQFVKTVGISEIKNQNALELFRSWIIARPGFAASGYVGAIDNLPDKSMVVMWYGARTPFLSAVIKEGRSRGIAVTIQPRKFSLQQISAATAAIWKQSADGEWTGFKVSAIIGVTPDYSGITVEGTYTRLPANRRAVKVRALATVVSGIPVKLEPGQPVTPASGRDLDTSPFNAGGFMEADNGAGLSCSSGFAVALNGVTHTTTARHCALEGGNEWADYYASPVYSDVPADERYGNTVELTSSEGGAAAILSGGGYPLMFSGNYTSDNTSSVENFGDLAVNDLVCTEGGNSGDHCDVKVTSLTASISDGDGSFLSIQAKQQQSTNIAVMAGDSGGPVMTLTGASSGEVLAAGMIENYGLPPLASCPSNVNLPSPCSLWVYFTSMRSIVKFTSGAQLVTVTGLISG